MQFTFQSRSIVRWVPCCNSAPSSKPPTRSFLQCRRFQLAPENQIKTRGLRTTISFVAALLALAMGAAAEEPVPLRLAEAVKMTLAHNPMHKAALADTKATLAVVREAQAPMLPRITFAENFTGGNDPVFVFGTKLRQQEFTARDFALNELNRPTPIGNYASLFFGQWTIF